MPKEFNFAEYQTRFEKEVIERGVMEGVLGKSLFVSTRDGKLHRILGPVLGDVVESGEEFAIDYYGYVKKSSALLQWVSDRRKDNPGVQISAVRSKVVYFSSLKIEYVAETSPELVAGFPFFKKQLLAYRGFKC